MSKTQLQTNNAKLSALITELQGKAAGGGGGAAETCTVQICCTVSIGVVYALCYTTIDGVQQIGNAGEKMQHTLENVICGSSISFIYSQTYSCDITTNNIELIGVYNEMPLTMIGRFLAFRAPSTSGTGTITIVDED